MLPPIGDDLERRVGLLPHAGLRTHDSVIGKWIGQGHPAANKIGCVSGHHCQAMQQRKGSDLLIDGMLRTWHTVAIVDQHLLQPLFQQFGLLLIGPMTFAGFTDDIGINQKHQPHLICRPVARSRHPAQHQAWQPVVRPDCGGVEPTRQPQGWTAQHRLIAQRASGCSWAHLSTHWSLEGQARARPNASCWPISAVAGAGDGSVAPAACGRRESAAAGRPSERPGRPGGCRGRRGFGAWRGLQSPAQPDRAGPHPRRERPPGQATDGTSAAINQQGGATGAEAGKGRGRAAGARAIGRARAIGGGQPCHGCKRSGAK